MNNSDIIKNLEDIVGKDNVKINESMANHTTFRVGGNADFYVTVHSSEQLKSIIMLDCGVPITVIGNGSNILVKDKGIRGIVISFKGDSLEIKDTTVKVGAGMMNGTLAQKLMNEELSGFEFASGIPGTIGGAIFMNAGAYGTEMKDIIQDVTYCDLRDGSIKTINNLQCEFSYRSSIFEKIETVILEATLNLQKGNKEDIRKKMVEYREKRINSQPLEFPNGGSTFKRGNDFITAELIDKAGLKGTKIGGAEVSAKHAGFIVNSGDATADDILKLIEYVQNKVYEKFNKKIEIELRVLGE